MQLHSFWNFFVPQIRYIGITFYFIFSYNDDNAGIHKNSYDADTACCIAIARREIRFR